MVECSCLRMSCQFQVSCKVVQFCIYMYLLFFRFFSHLDYHRVLTRFPCANTVDLCWLSILNIEVCMSDLSLPFGNHKFVFQSVSLFVLQMGSFLYIFFCLFLPVSNSAFGVIIDKDALLLSCHLPCLFLNLFPVSTFVKWQFSLVAYSVHSSFFLCFSPLFFLLCGVGSC